MWRCYNCGEDFSDPSTEHTTYERYYGVSGEFGNHTPISLEVCPYCGSDEIEEMDDDEYFEVREGEDE